MGTTIPEMDAMRAVSPSRIALAVLIFCLLGFQGGGHRRGIAPVYQLTFNSDEGDDDCTNHEADATVTARFDCNCTDGEGCDPQEGDGAMQHDGGGTTSTVVTEWCDVINPALDDFWVRFWLYVDEGGVNPVTFIMSFRKNGESCDSIGGGYSIWLWEYINDDIAIECDGATEIATPSGYLDQTWIELLFHVDLVNGNIDMWQNDFTGAADWSCISGAGTDSGFDGIRVTGKNVFDEVRWDNIRVYDKDPR